MTALHEFTLQVLPGAGLVGRFTDASLVVVPTSDGQRVLTAELLAFARASVGDGRRLVRHVVGTIAGAEPADVPALGVVCAVDEVLVILLHGALDAVLTGPNGTERLSGKDLVSWTERVIDTAIERLDVFADSARRDEADAQLDLRVGVVPGAGFSLITPTARTETRERPRAEVSRDAGTAETSQPEHPFASVVLTDAELDDRPPLPVATDTDPSMANDSHEHPAVIVTGNRCSRGHFNSPEAAYCGICGIAMVQLTRRPVDDVRPPLGYLVLDDGATFLVDRDYVIGREPERDPSVRDGRAAPIVLTDSDRKISRAHARVVLDGWDVKIVDQHSANGTFIEHVGESGWTRLGDDQAVTIRPGTRVMLGRRTFVFDSHYRP